MSPLNFDPKNDGYWGDTTATLDWCEKNYEVSCPISSSFTAHKELVASMQVSWYIAEFWNTLTNLSMIIPPLWGIHKCLQRGLETRYLVGFFALLLVGIGSTMFHMTLQWVTTSISFPLINMIHNSFPSMKPNIEKNFGEGNSTQ